tara:strand:- start:188 stop:766 length:579 start_codon:yes stop_codon:yes gene_type:complete
MIINILKTLPWYFVGLAVFLVPSVLLIASLLAPLDVESFFSNQFFADKFMDLETILNDEQDPANATADFNLMFAWLNIYLLITSIAISLSWAIGSHFLNIDEPGKAKFFGITWTIISGILVGSLLIVNYTIFSWSNFFMAQQDITVRDMNTMVLISTIYYSLMYWLSCILGTARQARSAVLLANKLPARNFL